jgi:hypothetical protein
MSDVAYAGSYARQLHEEHKARLQRMNAAALRIVPKTPIAIAVDNSEKTVSKPIEVISDDEYMAMLGTPRPSKPPGLFHLRDLLEETARRHGFTVTHLRSERKLQLLARARFEFYYRAYSETTASLPRIGRAIGDRDHTTVLSGIRRYCELHSIPYPTNNPNQKHSWR